MSTLTLSGWAQPADALTHLASYAATFDYSDYASLNAALMALKNSSQSQCTHCIAWSLGGVVALHAIAAGVMAPTHLTLIATPYQFVQTPDYSPAMDRFTYEKFYQNYKTSPARAKDRFLALIAKGDRDVKRILAALQHHPDVENTARWLPWLEQLSDRSLSATLARIQTPALVIHGTGDAIVPHPQTDTIAALLPNATVHRWQETGHAPHLHDAARLQSEIAAHRTAHKA